MSGLGAKIVGPGGPLKADMLPPPEVPQTLETSDAPIFYFWFSCFWGPWVQNRLRKTCTKNNYLVGPP